MIFRCFRMALSYTRTFICNLICYIYFKDFFRSTMKFIRDVQYKRKLVDKKAYRTNLFLTSQQFIAKLLCSSINDLVSAPLPVLHSKFSIFSPDSTHVHSEDSAQTAFQNTQRFRNPSHRHS